MVQTAAAILRHRGRSGIHSVESPAAAHEKNEPVEQQDLMATIAKKVQEILATGGRPGGRPQGSVRPGGAQRPPRPLGQAAMFARSTFSPTPAVSDSMTSWMWC